MKPSEFRVLLVDDEQMILNVLRRSLDDAGYACATATSGMAALAQFHEQPAHLLITDIRMPGMSGVQLADAILTAKPETLIVFITGYAEYAALSQAIKQQPLGFLEKPFLPEQLVALVDRAYKYCLENERAEAEGRQLQESVVEKTRELQFKTERLLAEKDLLNGIITNANFGLLAVDSANMTHLLNPLAADLLSIDRSIYPQYHGQNYQSLLPEVCRDRLTVLMTASRTQRGLQTVEFSNPQNDKQLNVIAYPIMHRNQPAAFVFIVHDVTEREILQKRLLQTAKLASIGELAAGVAHEINNPLGFVTSNCNTLSQYLTTLGQYIKTLEGLLSADEPSETGKRDVMLQAYRDLDIEFLQKDLSDLIRETVDGLCRVSKIVRDLKTFAHVDRDIAEPCDINSLIDNALNLARNEMKYNLEIRKNLASLPKVSGFPSQLVQVFTNMFVNAAHAVKTKGILTVTTEVDDTAVRIRIADTGEGIPEKNLPRIFDPFFTTKPPGTGTGMGLSISYGIIERHCGTITVTSQVGIGTEFVIALPLQTESEETESAATPAPVA